MPEPSRWRALAADALEPSAPASAPFVQAVLKHLPRAHQPVVHVVEDIDGALRCVAPLRHEPARWWPLGRLGSSRWSDFFFFGVPLLASAAPADTLRQLFASARHAGLAALEFRTVPADGPFLRALREALRETGAQPVELARWRRAALDATRAPEEWWRQDIARKRRKEWNRLKRKLAEQGDLSFECLPLDASAEELNAWLDDFLQLEAAGWKGRAGTALACSPHYTAFVQEMTANFHAEGNLRFWRLRLNGRTLASLFAMLQGDVLWLGKIAYDETMRACSPGVLLTLEATRDILADERVRLADSSADPNHPMIDHIWKQRLELVDVLVPLPGLSPARLAAIVAVERAFRAGREQAKRLWHAVRRKR